MGKNIRHFIECAINSSQTSYHHWKEHTILTVHAFSFACQKNTEFWLYENWM